jgi:hypothetical protein
MCATILYCSGNCQKIPAKTPFFGFRNSRVNLCFTVPGARLPESEEVSIFIKTETEGYDIITP